MALPREYQDVSIYMTQVLETMIERQRLEMHQKLNEMFKTYFDAKEMEITKAASEPDKNDEDDELYRYSFMLLFFCGLQFQKENCSTFYHLISASNF